MKNKQRLIITIILTMIVLSSSAYADENDLAIDAESIKERTQTVIAITDAYDMDILTEEYSYISDQIFAYNKRYYDKMQSELFYSSTSADKTEYERIVSMTQELNMFTSVNNNSYTQSTEEKNDTLYIILSVALFLLLGITGYILARANNMRKNQRE